MPVDVFDVVREHLGDHAGLVERARHDVLARQDLRELVAQILAREHLAWQRAHLDSLAEELTNELAGFGPLEPYLREDSISEIMVNGPGEVYVERDGSLELVPAKFRSRQHLDDFVQRIVAPLGRRIDQSRPFVDARLPDGSRVHAIIPPVAITGPYLTVRKFRRRLFSPADLIDAGSCSAEMMEFLGQAVHARCNIIIAGGTGSGKTTMLNALSSFIVPCERIVTIEDSAELVIQGNHVVSLEARPVNVEGRGEVTVRMLLRNALRMRPDRIIIGEVRGPEAFDLVQALHTGHEGSMSTVHANSPHDVLGRLAAMALMAGEDMPHGALAEQICAAIDLIVQQVRYPDGRRRTASIACVDGMAHRPKIATLFSFQLARSGGREEGEYLSEVDVLPRRIREKFSAIGARGWGEAK